MIILQGKKNYFNPEYGRADGKRKVRELKYEQPIIGFQAHWGAQ